MAWEVFKRDRIGVGEPALTITSMGRIALNKTASLRLQDQQVENVELLWDRVGSKIGFRSSSLPHRGTYRIIFGENANGSGFSCTTFLNHIGYDWSETRSFPLEWTASEEMYIVDLPREHFAKGGRLNRRTNIRKRIATEAIEDDSKQSGEFVFDVDIALEPVKGNA